MKITARYEKSVKVTKMFSEIPQQREVGRLQRTHHSNFARDEQTLPKPCCLQRSLYAIHIPLWTYNPWLMEEDNHINIHKNGSKEKKTLPQTKHTPRKNIVIQRHVNHNDTTLSLVVESVVDDRRVMRNRCSRAQATTSGWRGRS